MSQPNVLVTRPIIDAPLARLRERCDVTVHENDFGIPRDFDGRPVDITVFDDVISVWTIAKMRTNDLPSVLKGLSFLTAPESRQGVSASYPFAFVTLARVQMRMGNKEEARKNYQKFFDLFKDADPDLPLLLEAREEFGKLGS